MPTDRETEVHDEGSLIRGVHPTHGPISHARLFACLVGRVAPLPALSALVSSFRQV